ncbi:HDOD domain-containing protein [Leptothrix discophora]|uniref:HDOD domain-containing protein n=1 Tax=Leptothrix discophora TaxID=89 RepID=A0ABT9G2C1_LEPDI|nr:HDOD domain-containing protein [Leptothrix discophora]MDP4300612.1 HDOD domain-containing protein [Leptothrix discophora]
MPPSNASTRAPSVASPRAAAAVARTFGRFELRELMGRSSQSMAWLAHDPQVRQDVWLLIARQPMDDRHELAAAVDNLRRAARLEHPRLLQAVESGAHGGRVYVVCDRPQGAVTLAQHLSQRKPGAPVEVVGWAIDALEGLAYLHDAGYAHGDVGLHTLFVARNGRIQAWGSGMPGSRTAPSPDTTTDDPEDPIAARRHLASDRDVLAIGLLLYAWIAHAPALDEPDVPSAVDRLGQDIVRLPWSLPAPVSDALRAILNRATDRHERRRYLGARSLERALSGWRQVESADRGGPLALLLDRLRVNGHLPALPGLAQRVVQLSRMETRRLDELTDVVLEDPALSFELLRSVNSASIGLMADDGVTTVRRAIQLIGLTGVRRAASTLRAWPGPLRDGAAERLDKAMRRACLAGHLAEVLVPAGLDAEGALIAAQLQHLGRLVTYYHFPDEAVQIRQLMQPGPPLREGDPVTPGLSEDAAAMAVLGVDLQSMANALARHWGLDDSVQETMLPLPLNQTVVAPHTVDGWLRLVSSCANETLQAFDAPTGAQPRALAQVANRYARALGTSVDILKQAYLDAREKLSRHLQIKAA